MQDSIKNRPLPAADTIQINCDVERESVCAADDVNAPNAAKFCCNVEANSENFALECIRQIACRETYLPSVAGPTTWIAYIDSIPIAVCEKHSETNVYPTGQMLERSIVDASFKIYFSYYLANNKNRILTEIALRKVPERKYEE